jgi:RND family efflux transporter MFP subunit
VAQRAARGFFGKSKPPAAVVTLLLSSALSGSRGITSVSVGKDGTVVRQLRTLFSVGVIGELTDGQLLERFATSRDEAAELAFAVLVERHGPMVLRVCRGVLADAHDSQDAFQATFLVLVQRARGLCVRESLGPWLHQVAFRTASCARSAAARRRRHERAASLLTAAQPSSGDPDAELRRVLHEELERLPDRYRTPLVLCDLEGHTHEQAARHLGWPVGTVKTRLTRGRQRLGKRLRRRGFNPNAGLMAAAPGLAGPEALAPTALLDSTTRAAVHWPTDGTAGSGSAALLAQEVLRAMSMTPWWKAASLVFLAGVTASALATQDRTGPSSDKVRAEARLKAARGDDHPVITVASGKLRVTLSEPGLVEASESLDVFCQVEGRTTIISILPEGTRVTKGQLVCELDSSRLRDALENQRITTLGAEAAFQNARIAREVAAIAITEYAEGIHKSELGVILGEIAAAESALQKAKARLARTDDALKRLRDAGALKAPRDAPTEVLAELEIEAQLDAAGQAVLLETHALERALQKRDLLEKYTRDKIIRQLQSEFDKAKSNELARQHAWDMEKDRQDKLEHQLSYCSLRAPADGIVVYANDPSRFGGGSQPQVEEGAAVRERQKIFSLPNLQRMRIKTRVPESEIARIVPGQAAQIQIHAFPKTPLTGKVVDVYPLPDSPRAGVQGPALYTVHVDLDKGPAGVRPGMSADAQIVLADLDHVLTVPASALRSFDGKTHVAVKRDDGGFDWREVTPGLSDGASVEIKDGLQSGERVIRDMGLLFRDDTGARSAPVSGAPSM